MKQFRILELKYLIENIELEIEDHDLTDQEMKERKKDLERAKEQLKELEE